MEGCTFVYKVANTEIQHVILTQLDQGIIVTTICHADDSDKHIRMS